MEVFAGGWILHRRNKSMIVIVMVHVDDYRRNWKMKMRIEGYGGVCLAGSDGRLQRKPSAMCVS